MISLQKSPLDLLDDAFSFSVSQLGNRSFGWGRAPSCSPGCARCTKDLGHPARRRFRQVQLLRLPHNAAGNYCTGMALGRLQASSAVIVQFPQRTEGFLGVGEVRVKRTSHPILVWVGGFATIIRRVG